MSILDFKQEMDTRFQPDRDSKDPRDDLSSIPSQAPSLAASNASRANLDLFGQSVQLNSFEKGWSSCGPTIPTPGKLGFGVLARTAPGISTKVDKLRD